MTLTSVLSKATYPHPPQCLVAVPSWWTCDTVYSSRTEYDLDLGVVKSYLPSSPAVSGGCAFMVNMRRSLQFADSVMLSVALKVWPRQDSPTRDTMSSTRFNHCKYLSQIKQAFWEYCWKNIESLLAQNKI